MPERIKLAFASGTDDLNRELIARMRDVFPELPLWVVSDFPPDDKALPWIPWRSGRTLSENYAAARAAIGKRSVRLAAVMLVPNVPFRRMRVMAFLLSPAGFLAWNEHLSNFMLRPGSLPAILRHIVWRSSNLLRHTLKSVRETNWPVVIAERRARLAARSRPQSAAPRPANEVLTALEQSYRAALQGESTSFDGLASLDGSGQRALEFLVRNIQSHELFTELWNRQVRLLAEAEDIETLRRAPSIVRKEVAWIPNPVLPEPLVLAMTTSDVAVFSGRAPASPSSRPRVVIAAPYIPFPLSHGGAVRMYNLMLRAAADFDQILVCFVDTLAAPPPELLAICAEIVLVRREGMHDIPSHGRPDTVEEFDSPAFHGALRLAVRKWRPAVAQLEFTQMAQYAADCSPARTLLIEHDITFDLHQQMLAIGDDWEVRRQLGLWRSFETAAWRQIDRVVVMSEKDRALAASSRAEARVLPNGVDLNRFRPAEHDPEPNRILFIGSFAHLPNQLALELFLNEVWPSLPGTTLHVIAGSNREYFLDYYRDRVRLNLSHPCLRLEGFVSDVRPAYESATVVIAPLVVSAGTNIKVLEAMAMGKAVVSTPAGVNGLDLHPGEDFLLVRTAAEMATAVSGLCSDPAARIRIERAARQTAEREYGWDAIALRQTALYRELIPCVS